MKIFLLIMAGSTFLGLWLIDAALPGLFASFFRRRRRDPDPPGTPPDHIPS